MKTLKVISVVVFLLVMQMIVNLSGVTIVSAQVDTPTDIIINDIPDPSMPTTLSGHVFPTNSVLSNFTVFIQNVNTGEVWTGTDWDSSTDKEFPISLKPDGTFSFNLSSVSFIKDEQYAIDISASDSSDNYISTYEVFTYGNSPLAVVINPLNGYKKITGKSTEQPTLQLYETTFYNCWNGTSWSGTPTCSLSPEYNSNTQEWSLDISNIPFTQNSQYEIDAYNPSSDVSDSKIFYYSTNNSDPVLTSVAITPTNPSVETGDTQQFTAIGYDQNQVVLTDQPTFTWTSSNSNIGTIDNSGLFDAVSVGTTTIKAKNGTVSTSASVVVTPKVQTCVTGADIDGNKTISLTELLNYIGSWKTGNVSLPFLLDSIGFWKTGSGC